ncbi:MAG: AraC family transcriptional regulator [Burkholderiaceae bacterium]
MNVHSGKSRKPAPRFWRDAALPFIEARYVADGRKVCYENHAHAIFSIGAITGGCSTYINGDSRHSVSEGCVVVINPEQVHACNPIDDQPWSYCMFYVDAAWLTGLQHELGFSQGLGFRKFATTLTTDPVLYRGLNHLYKTLIDKDAGQLCKHSTAILFFSEVQTRLNPAPELFHIENNKLERAAEFISAHCTRDLRLDDICAAAELSPSYLIRAFRKQYGMTPHVYLVNRRIQYAQAQLKCGRPIADVALDAGFADQAHFQRVFKRLLAATPGQYLA